jgi:uncharacterized RDD family membrane protein YckC
MDPTAVMGKRIGAYIIDAIIGTAVAVIALLALSDKVETGIDLCGITNHGPLCFFAGDTMYIAEGGQGAAIIAVSLGFWIVAMGTLFQGLTGGTPGKLMVGLRVVDQESGQLAGIGKCAGRSILWVADAQPLGAPIVGLVTAASSKGHRRVGDMVAKTLVVDKKSVGIPPLVAGLTAAKGVYTPVPPGGYAAPVAPGGYNPPAPGGYAPPPPGEYNPAPFTDASVIPPAGPPMAPPPPAVAQPANDGIEAPKWDADREAYIQWDPELNAWMQFDDSSQQWIPITQ